MCFSNAFKFPCRWFGNCSSDSPRQESSRGPWKLSLVSLSSLVSLLALVSFLVVAVVAAAVVVAVVVVVLVVVVVVVVVVEVVVLSLLVLLSLLPVSLSLVVVVAVVVVVVAVLEDAREGGVHLDLLHRSGLVLRWYNIVIIRIIINTHNTYTNIHCVYYTVIMNIVITFFTGAASSSGAVRRRQSNEWISLPIKSKKHISILWHRIA